MLMFFVHLAISCSTFPSIAPRVSFFRTAVLVTPGLLHLVVFWVLFSLITCCNFTIGGQRLFPGSGVHKRGLHDNDRSASGGLGR